MEGHSRMKIDNVLGDNIGFIELVDSMGSDLTIVNSARVSFGKRREELGKGDKGLINFLAKHKHWSPFRHVMFQFHVKAPEIVGRQFYKHVIGSDYTFKDHAWNEISGRYVVYENEFYIPPKFRVQSDDNKQASEEGELKNGNTAMWWFYKGCMDEAYKNYEQALEEGVAKEQARCLLPVSFYTEWYWTASLQAVMNFIHLRDDGHAQSEIQKYAKAMKELILPIAPIGIGALLENM